ncbi:hypothetical protein [Longispora urticae]
MSFEETLRAAIEASGLTLRDLRDLLRRDGLAVSPATLSHWQSGRSRPERPRSLLVLHRLEGILGFADGGLSSLLGSVRSRGRTQQRPGGLTPAQLWTDGVAVAALTGRLAPAGLSPLSHHDRVAIGPDRRARSVRTWQVLRADVDGADRTTVVAHVADPGARPPVVRALNRCRTGRSARDAGAGLLAVELVLERPLARGETVALEYEVRHRPPYPLDSHYERKLPWPVRHHVLEVDFPATLPPPRCEYYTAPHVDVRPRVHRELPPDADHRVHAVAVDVAPGVSGIRWTW